MRRMGLMARSVALVSSLCAPFLLSAQTAPPSASTLRAIRVEGNKQIPEDQIVAFSGLQTGSEIHREDLQSAADRLVQTGLFANVKYSFKPKPEGVALTFTLEEAPLLPVCYDNFPWLDDSELNDPIRKKFGVYNGKLPPAGTVVDDAATAITALIAARGIDGTLDPMVLANPI